MYKTKCRLFKIVNEKERGTLIQGKKRPQQSFYDNGANFFGSNGTYVTSGGPVLYNLVFEVDFPHPKVSKATIEILLSDYFRKFLKDKGFGKMSTECKNFISSRIKDDITIVTNDDDESIAVCDRKFFPEGYGSWEEFLDAKLS